MHCCPFPHAQLRLWHNGQSLHVRGSLAGLLARGNTEHHTSIREHAPSTGRARRCLYDVKPFLAYRRVTTRK
ncbi:hypothetical protein SRU_0228 [Salinibacter ruber DSM 13855]|uniref:Uncharacterized protein n=1 Tax=Salinibacter ruber (strain DSM 13855 / M31) TaxID=309807 RepID=Q2S604_SALRD|nr:hypothetical protein SRU_0228 [Salinibacter ruber DSM 13855]